MVEPAIEFGRKDVANLHLQQSHFGFKNLYLAHVCPKTSDTHAAANISRDRVKATHPHANYQATSSTNDDSRCPQHSRCPQCSQALVWSPPPGHIEWHKQLQKLMIRSSHLKNASRTITWPRNHTKQIAGKICLYKSLYLQLHAFCLPLRIAFGKKVLAQNPSQTKHIISEYRNMPDPNVFSNAFLVLPKRI